MKFIFCKECKDVVNLAYIKRSCLCGKSSGVYRDSLNAVITGPCVPIGIANGSFIEALKQRPKSGMGKEFIAFVIPEQCDTIEVKDEV